MPRAHVLISGLVQGVFFRYHTKEKARYLGIYGWVRNLPDGRVEAVFEGEKEKIDQMIKWCFKGSPGHVADVKVEWQEGALQYTDFTIKR